MNKLVEKFCLAAFSVVLVMVGGCGGGGGSASVVMDSSCTVSFEATINQDGTATTGANTTTVITASCTPGYLSGVSVTLPPNTAITARNSDGTMKPLTAPLSLTFTAPADSTATFSGIHGVPVPTGFATLVSTAGAIDIRLTGAASATFNQAIAITMPVPGKAVDSMVAIFSVAGATYTLLGGYTVATAGFVSFPVSSLSWKVGNPNGGTGVPTTAATTVPATTTTPTTTTTTTATTITAGSTTTPTTSITSAPTTAPTTTTITAGSTTTPTTVAPTTTAPTTTLTTSTTSAPTTTTTTILTTVSTTSTTTVAPLDGRALYENSCQRCHGPLASPSPPIEKSLEEIRASLMGQGLSDEELLAIIAVLP